MDKQISASPIKVLCVEDEEFISELYSRALNKEGYAVTTVRSGAEGLKLAKTGAFDVLLLDLMIPDILGAEVLRRLRHEAPDLKTKVVIITNLEESDKVREEIEKQADGYIIKAEITPKQLVAFLNNLKTS